MFVTRTMNNSMALTTENSSRCNTEPVTYGDNAGTKHLFMILDAFALSFLMQKTQPQEIADLNTHRFYFLG